MSTIKFTIQSKSYNCDIELKHRITVIQGNSGIGKTALVDFIKSEAKSVKVESTLPIIPTDKYNCGFTLSQARDSIIILDDLKYVETQDFIEIVNKRVIKNNLYLVIMCRADTPKMGSILLNAHAIYEMQYDEVSNTHYIIKAYDKQFKSLHQCLNSHKKVFILTEDSQAGKTFFKELSQYKEVDLIDKRGMAIEEVIDEKDSLLTSATGGKGSIVDDAKKCLIACNCVICIVDMASYGYHISRFTRLIKKCKKQGKDLTLLYDFECFEEVLVRSNLLKDNPIVKEELSNLQEYANKHSSWENYFKDLSARVTSGMPWVYKHKRGYTLSRCYYKECEGCTDIRNKQCPLTTKGDKFVNLLKGTKFEYLLLLRGINQNLLRKYSKETSFFS